MYQEVECPDCSGSGQMGQAECRTCGGDGTIEEMVAIEETDPMEEKANVVVGTMPDSAGFSWDLWPNGQLDLFTGSDVMNLTLLAELPAETVQALRTWLIENAAPERLRIGEGL